MPTTPDRRKLRHTAIVAPTEDNHHAPKPPSCRVPSTTFKKECDDDDAAARTSPRISPGTRRVEGGEGHPTPFKKDGGARRRHRVGAGKTRHGFLPTSRAHHPGPTFGSTTPAAHQHAPTVTRTPPSSHHGQRSEAGRIQTRHPKTRTGSTAATREGTTSTGLGGSRPGIAAEAHQTPCPARPCVGP